MLNTIVFITSQIGMDQLRLSGLGKLRSKSNRRRNDSRPEPMKMNESMAQMVQRFNPSLGIVSRIGKNTVLLLAFL